MLAVRRTNKHRVGKVLRSKISKCVDVLLRRAVVQCVEGRLQFGVVGVVRADNEFLLLSTAAILQYGDPELRPV